MMKKEFYVAPESEVLELRLEGVVAASGDGNLGDYIPEDMGGSWS